MDCGKRCRVAGLFGKRSALFEGGGDLAFRATESPAEAKRTRAGRNRELQVIGCVRKVSNQFAGALPVPQRFFTIGEPGSFCSTRVPTCGEEGLTGFRPVMRQQRGALVKLRSITRLHLAGDGSMRLTPTILEQTAKRDFLGERVAEGIFCDWV